MLQVPILILSDAPDQTTGLARITRDLATLLARMPEFRVATLGLGGRGDVRFPWQQYQLYAGKYAEYGEFSLPWCWDNFSQGQRGIVLTIWDLTRILWLARPEYGPDSTKEWLQEARKDQAKFVLWSYLPIDATGPGNKLTGIMKEALLGIDRVLTYTPWALNVVRNTIGAEEAARRGADWLPHGIGQNFCPLTPVYTLQKPSEASEAEKTVDGLSSPQRGGSSDSVKRVGIVMTNQARKDWELTAAICSELVTRLSGNVRFWWHVD